MGKEDIGKDPFVGLPRRDFYTDVVVRVPSVFLAGPEAAMEKVRRAIEDSGARVVSASTLECPEGGVEGHAAVSKTRPAKPRKGQLVAASAGIKPGPSDPKKSGRPSKHGEKPWEAEGISRQAWYKRRKKAGRV